MIFCGCYNEKRGQPHEILEKTGYIYIGSSGECRNFCSGGRHELGIILRHAAADGADAGCCNMQHPNFCISSRESETRLRCVICPAGGLNHKDIENFLAATNAIDKNGLKVIPNKANMNLYFKEIIL